MSTSPDIVERYSWWASLSHGGLLLAPSKLAEFFPAELPSLERPLADRLRRDLVRLREGGEGTLAAFLDSVLEDVLGLHAARWIKGSQVDKSWSRVAVTRESIRPRRVWLGPNGAVLPVFVADGSLGGSDEGMARLGVGRGRRAVSRVVEWLRKANHKIALLAGGRHLRLIHAGSDYDAYCEWDTDLWFQEGLPGPQVDALRILLGQETLVPAVEGKPSRLLSAIQATRQGQAELSAQLGERVRQAVETLITASASGLERIDRKGPEHVSRRDIYIAATRLIMRCVVVLFAEARQDDLLPRNNPIYESSYGLASLREQLDRLSGGRASERLRHSHSAWPRLLGLFDLLYFGSGHEKLPVTRYGGGLFTPGDANSRDPVLRALAAFESPENAPADAAVHRILELLTRSPVKVRQGKSSRWVEAPVDFSDLSSEYIGILYEGLLDFELRRAPDDEAMVFLNLGDEPVLPISRLDRMTNEELAQLLDKLAKGAKKSGPDEEEGEDEEESDAEADAESDAAADAGAEAGAEAGADAGAAADAGAVAEADAGDTRAIREKIQLWAERAVKSAKIVKYPRKDTDPRVRDAFAQEVTAKARSLIKKSVMPGAWYLVRWGGTRKGSGTFYTRPQLAGPTVRRALEPLSFVTESESLVPKKPEEILALKVCDPAMGSGSFLISALRYLTEALFESLHHHGRLESRGDGVIPRLAEGLPADHPWNETLPVPKDHPDFDKTLRARLKRHVVERCIYGVDLDPLAVELAKTALWVETMDPKLPLGFFDHKLKCGNSLVGCWFDRFQDYPIMAWEREGGDAKHDRFVHHYREFFATKGKDKGKTLRSGDKWTFAIKERRDKYIKPELERWLEERFSRQVKFEFAIDGKTAEVLHDEALAVFERMHALPVHDAEGRERIYREEIVESPVIQRLREAFDTWCALWFWPGDELEKAPGAREFLQPSEEAREVVRRVREEVRFFHWEMEFAEVFTGPESGFHAVLGNPPWETVEATSLEFFSNIDPLFRTYPKLNALGRQEELFESSATVERDWIAHVARFKGLVNWHQMVGEPLHAKGSKDASPSKLRSMSDPEHPFVHQGVGKPYTYRLFAELAHALLQPGGHIGLLVPSGLYSDAGTAGLRRLFIERSAWIQLYAFQNERFVFDGIHHSFKMAVVHIQKSAIQPIVLMRFRLGPGGSPEASELEQELLDLQGYLPVPTARIQEFSPHSKAIAEVEDPRDLKLLKALFSGTVRVGDAHHGTWQAVHAHEVGNPTKEARQGKLVIATSAKLEPLGIDGFWKGATGESILPFIQGVSFEAFRYNSKVWVHGHGAHQVWESTVPTANPVNRPQYVIGDKDCLRNVYFGVKIAYRNIARSTDARTMIAAAIPGFPTGNATPTLRLEGNELATLGLLAILNALVFDFVARLRCVGSHVDFHVLAELPVPTPGCVPIAVQLLTLRLAATSPSFSRVWDQAHRIAPSFSQFPWRRLWAVTPHERLRLRSILDAVVAKLYGLDLDDFSWILRDCDHPIVKVNDKPFSRTLDPKGFWRVDKQQDPELRHPVLSLVAFHELERMGLDAFLAQNDGEGWMLPEKLRLADYGLGHDERAKEEQPVAERMGPRFLGWQLEQGVEESWEECRRHAEMIERILGLSSHARAGAEAGADAAAGAAAGADAGAVAGAGAGAEKRVVNTEGQVMMFAPKPEELPPQLGLFGDVEETKPGRKGKARK